jgi:putative ABC transport system permease protein
MTKTSLEYGLAAVALALLSQILPTIGAARHTVTTYKQERSRMLRKPWWQRAWLDVMLFIPTGYGAYLLRQQGAVALMSNRNPFDNPLLFLIPALCVFSLSLFFMRLMPLLVSAVAWISSKTRSVGLLMASRQLSRTPSFYVTPLMLLILTLSLSAYTASLAVTVDRHLYDQTFYSVGGDLKFLDSGESQNNSSPFGGGGPAASSTDNSSGDSSGFAISAVSTDSEPVWVFLPVQEYLKIPGITKVARVGRYPASASMGGTDQDGTYLGIDRYDFPLVSYWRSDFSSTNMGELMNFLAMYPDGVLIPQSYVGQEGMKIGDTLPVIVKIYGDEVKVDYKIVGGFKYFPTWYPSTGPLIVGNLDYLFNEAGGMFPYQVWLKTVPGLDLNELQQHGTSADGTVRLTDVTIDSALTEIETEQAQPQRQGLFGVLSVGFFPAVCPVFFPSPLYRAGCAACYRLVVWADGLLPGLGAGFPDLDGYWSRHISGGWHCQLVHSLYATRLWRSGLHSSLCYSNLLAGYPPDLFLVWHRVRPRAGRTGYHAAADEDFSGD